MITPARSNPSIDHPLTIGPLTLETNLLLAPIAGYCDLATRITARELGGLALACTDLLSPQGLLRGTRHSLDLARTHDLDQPICMQLYGADPDILCDGARWAIEHHAKVIDINMGCPVDKVTKTDGGSKLLCDIPRTVKTTERIVREVEQHSGGTVPVTAKVRLGWEMGEHVAPEMARRLEGVGVQLITVHGRTTAQRFKGDVIHSGIAEVVEAVDSIPVIGNGDVKTPQDALAMMEKTGCTGVMIGRGSFARPWIFRDTWHYFTTGDLLPEPSEAEKIAIIRRYFDLLLEFKELRQAMIHIERRISWFGKTLGASKPFKEKIRTAKEPQQVYDAFDEFLAGGLRVFDRNETSAASAGVTEN
jgi:nifR3 family TIM-barrel protein